MNWKVKGGYSQLRNNLQLANNTIGYIPLQLRELEVRKLSKLELKQLKDDLLTYLGHLEHNFKAFGEIYTEIEYLEAEVIE